jgi:hypothetical protein
VHEQVGTIPEFNLREHIVVEDYSGEAEAIAQLFQKTYNIPSGHALTQLIYPCPEALDPILFYIEGYVSAYRPQLQRIFADVGLSPAPLDLMRKGMRHW